MTVVLNDNNELIPSRTITGWRVCIDYRKLMDHFPLPFIDQMLERLSENEYYCFLDGFLGFFQIPIAPEDQEKMMFICPYETFAYRRMLFGLCNAPTTFQRCMTAIFHDMVENFMGVFMDDFLVFVILRKQDAKPRLIRWVLLLQGFNIKIKDKKGTKNLAADHLSRLENLNMGELAEEEIIDKFPDEHLMILKIKLNDEEPWYANYVNYIDEPYAFKLCPDNVMRRCIIGNEILKILAHCHCGPTGGHHSASVTGRKVYEAGFYWPSIFRDVKDYVMKCDAFEIKHKAYWALKQCNMDLTAAAKNRFMELNELIELRDGAYKNTRIYKEKTKKWHDSRLRGDKDFKNGDKVLLFNSRLKLHPWKLKSKWTDPFVVKTMYPYGAIEITDKDGSSFKVNGHSLKKYHNKSYNMDDNEFVELDTNHTAYPRVWDTAY
ncbi:reverse transcriptase domain-containing protein [Tanacetum coccineum]